MVSVSVHGGVDPDGQDGPAGDHHGNACDDQWVGHRHFSFCALRRVTHALRAAMLSSVFDLAAMTAPPLAPPLRPNSLRFSFGSCKKAVVIAWVLLRYEHCLHLAVRPRRAAFDAAFLLIIDFVGHGPSNPGHNSMDGAMRHFWQRPCLLRTRRPFRTNLHPHNLQ
jgi:hypothetical protein